MAGEVGQTNVDGYEGESVLGSPRGVVADFQIAVERERRKLEAVIADARSRQQEARAALGIHRTMEGMILDAQREMADLRRDSRVAVNRVLADTQFSGSDPVSSPPEVDRVSLGRTGREHTNLEEIKWT